MRGDTTQGSRYNTAASAVAVRLIFLFGRQEGGAAGEGRGLLDLSSANATSLETCCSEQLRSLARTQCTCAWASWKHGAFTEIRYKNSQAGTVCE